MSENMPTSWRYLSSAGNRLTSFKSYISSREQGASGRSPRTTPGPDGEGRQGWRAWAGQKIRGRTRGGNDAGDGNAEIINLFPGWAARRYVQGNGSQDPPPFEVEVFVSGFASLRRNPENTSRSQRAFVRLAKTFAALPKLVDNPAAILANSSSLAHLTPSTEELLAGVKLPPRPEEISDDFDVEALERQLRRAKESNPEDTDDDDAMSDSSSSSSVSDLPMPSRATPMVMEGTSTPIDALRRLHENLEKRVQLLWYSVLANRTIRLHLFVAPPRSEDKDRSSEVIEAMSIDPEYGPLASQDVTTAPDGSFQARLKVKWSDLCQHPRALHIAFGDSVEDHDLLVVAQLVHTGHSQTGTPARTPQTVTKSSGPSASYFLQQPRNDQSQAPDPSHLPTVPNTPLTSTSAPLAAITRIPITHSPIRVVSDIDDTVKHSGILSGARVAFYNVFVRELKDNVIPGMGEWYVSMFNKGVRFHYVSNGPFAVLPVINEFFQVSNLPPGSIKLRSYAGRSLFDGLLSAPAARKRAGIVEVLDSFPDSKFLLVGDTGEQDLELYADLARERPHQILGAFLRDADPNNEPINDPTGWKALGAAGTRPNDRPLVARSETKDSTSTGGSLTSFLGKYTSYGGGGSGGSNGNPPSVPSKRSAKARKQQEDMNQTPKPDRQSYPAQGAQSAGSSLDDEAFARAIEQEPYFEGGPIVSEPVSSPEEIPDAQMDSIATPTLRSSGVMIGPSGTFKGLKSASQPTPGSPFLPPSSSNTASQGYIAQPPKPTPPPSVINPNLHPASSGVSFRSQQTGSSTSSASSVGGGRRNLSEPEKRRNELQARVYRARTQMPSHVPLRVFRQPTECVEVEDILQREGCVEQPGGGTADMS